MRPADHLDSTASGRWRWPRALFSEVLLLMSPPRCASAWVQGDISPLTLREETCGGKSGESDARGSRLYSITPDHCCMSSRQSPITGRTRSTRSWPEHKAVAILLAISTGPLSCATYHHEPDSLSDTRPGIGSVVQHRFFRRPLEAR